MDREAWGAQRVEHNRVTITFMLLSQWLNSKNSPAMQEMGQEPQGGFLGWENPLKKETATHFSILAWNILQTEKPGGLQSMDSQRVRHDQMTEHSSLYINLQP